MGKNIKYIHVHPKNVFGPLHFPQKSLISGAFAAFEIEKSREHFLGWDVITCTAFQSIIDCPQSALLWKRGMTITPTVFQSIIDCPQSALPWKRRMTIGKFHATGNQCPFKIGWQLRTQSVSLLVAHPRLDEG